MAAMCVGVKRRGSSGRGKREATMANWQVLMEMSLSSTGVKDDADVAKDAIFSEKCLWWRGL